MENKEIVYEKSFGMETFGKIQIENGLYQCYETPLFGGEFAKCGNPFKELSKAIEYLNSLT